MSTLGVTMERDASERSIDDFLRDEGIFDEVVTATTLRVLAPENGNVTLDTIARTANGLDRTIRLELV